MKFIDKLNTLNEIEIDDTFTAEIESLYNTTLPDDVKRIISLHKEAVSYEDKSILQSLSYDDMLHATEDLMVDFLALNLLPILDEGENDYISYDVIEQCWYKFNIVEEVKFSKTFDLLTYFRGVPKTSEIC